MNRKLTVKLALSTTLFAAALFIYCAPAAAQCAMCKTALTNSPDTARLAENFNYAVLVLLIPPVLLFCGIFVAAYKFRKGPEQSAAEDGAAKRSPRSLLERLGARLRRSGRKGDEGRRRAGLSFH
ncbi:MAG TPA: hypothetical protein VEV81_11800 [Pyrinomonadaceae bacterium]|nr:hypothetical protein [Pyrinomonadaceae bacterium]